MLKKLTVEDFAVLRGSLESGRQSPNSLGTALFLGAFMQGLFYYITYYIAAEYTVFPNVEIIKMVHFWITALLISFSIIYAIPPIFMRSQKIQYFLVILMSQNLGAAFCYLGALFLIGEGENISIVSLMNFTIITLIIGILFFLVISIRFYILLQKGKYRKGSKKDKLRGRFETTSYLPVVIVASTGFVFILQFLFRTFQFADYETFFLIVLGLLIFYAMIFVLPEQLVILYCKFRFKSFNYDRKGYLLDE
ncbi:ABC transporter ATPase [Bacillaceae bacterium Marseille-Q3522]|nr:ABC transporter ATPase [Bacillaceae bacterium Marseille-Q3522]